MVIQVRGRLLDTVPGSLEEFFKQNPEICEANLELTSMPHVKMWREEVLFIKQRQQATSDYRENRKVRWIGSHAAMTCHIAIMRHTETGVASIGHFDNFCCWQFGEESSAHKDGIRIMVEEIGALSRDDEGGGQIEVSVVGGYMDARGDAAKNSMSLLKAIQDDPRTLEVVHFCVGRYNTTFITNEYGARTAILKGIAIDLKTQKLFPAVFNWNQYSDFKTQILDSFRRKTGKDPLDSEDVHKTRGSTFKPKSLRNRNNHRILQDHYNQQDEDKSKKRSYNPENQIRLKPIFKSDKKRVK